MKSPYKSKFRVSQIYKGATHKGIDLVGVDDKGIYSTVAGVVEAARWDTHPSGGFGLYVRIKEFGTNYYHYFAHLSSVLVKIGDVVSPGTKIGVEGSTGNSTGSHLHYEIRKQLDNTTYINVAEWAEFTNVLGHVHTTVKEDPITTPGARSILSEAGLTEKELLIFDMMKGGDDLMAKLARLIKGSSV